MNKKVRWGVLSTASIGVKKVIPAMQHGQLSTVAAIASRDLAKARAVAAAAQHSHRLRLLRRTPRRPQHRRHLQSASQSASRSLDHQRRRSRQARPLRKTPQHEPSPKPKSLLAVRDRTGVLIGEAFMIRSHPQWLRLRALIDEGRIGTAPLHRRLLQLLQHRPRQHPQYSGNRRRRPL